jgi:O-antigen/teichoic acid export membrane protein
VSSFENLEILNADSVAAVARVPARFSNRRAYAQTMAATVAVRCFGAASGILAARLLGPAGRGELAVIVFMPMMLISWGEFEFSRSVVVESSKSGEASPVLVATAFWVAILLGTVEMVLLAIALRFFLPPDKLYLLGSARWFALYLPVTYVMVSLVGTDQGRGRFGRFSLFQIMPGMIYLLAIGCVIWPAHRDSPQTFALATLTGVISAAVLRAAIDWRRILGVRPTWAMASRLLRRGFSFYLPALAGLALLRADMLLLVRLAPAAAIGAYAVAQAIAMGQIGIVNPFVQVGFAAVAGETEHGRALETLARHFRLAQVAVAGTAILAAAMASWAIRVLIGPEFLAATTATYFLIGASGFWGMGQTLEQGLRAASHPSLGIFSNLLGLATLLSAGVPAYLHFGITGLAAAVCIGQGVNLLALIGFCVFHLQMRFGLFWAFDATTFHEMKAVTAALRKRIGWVGV